MSRLVHWSASIPTHEHITLRLPKTLSTAVPPQLLRALEGQAAFAVVGPAQGRSLELLGRRMISGATLFLVSRRARRVEGLKD